MFGRRSDGPIDNGHCRFHGCAESAAGRFRSASAAVTGFGGVDIDAMLPAAGGLVESERSARSRSAGCAVCVSPRRSSESTADHGVSTCKYANYYQNGRPGFLIFVVDPRTRVLHAGVRRPARRIVEPAPLVVRGVDRERMELKCMNRGGWAVCAEPLS